MQKKQMLVSVLTLICALASLVLSFLAFLRSDRTADLDMLQQQISVLESRVDQLTARLTGEVIVSDGVASDAFCNLIVDTYSADEETLIINDLYLQVQLPQSAVSSTSVRRSELILVLADNILYQQEVSLLPGESEGGFELALSNLKLPLPEMTAEDQLDLMLEVALSDGQMLQPASVSWFMSGDQLYLLAG